MNNKAFPPDVKFQELYLFCRNLPRLHRRNRKDIWIGVQVVEKLENVDPNERNHDTTTGGPEF